MAEALQAFSDTPIYLIWMIVLGAFPVITAMLAIDSSRRFVLDREDGDLGILPDEADLRSARQEFGLITVMISARNEEALLGATIESVLRLDWPRVELFVIDDGSTDGTFEVAKSFIRDPHPEGGHLVGEATSRDSVTIPPGDPLAGDVDGWVERLDPHTLEVTATTRRWPSGRYWPGGIAAHANGDLYAVLGGPGPRGARSARCQGPAGHPAGRVSGD
ncbi:MAG: glycosyltransferase, partial [Solirubrobacterales bacterium]